MLERICILELIKDSDLLEFLFWHFLRRPEKTAGPQAPPVPSPAPPLSLLPRAPRGISQKKAQRRGQAMVFLAPRAPEGPLRFLPLPCTSDFSICVRACACRGRGGLQVNPAWSRVWRSQVRSVPTLGLLEVGNAAQQLAPWMCQDGPNVLIFLKKEMG